jgi:fluoroacetyl-CoA thioesterase
MKATLVAGVSTTRTFAVDRERTIDFMGDIEVACREFLLGHLDPGEDSVGTRVELDHTAPTLLGMTVRIEATVAEVKGRAVTFDVTGSDGVDTICRGRHMRYVVDVKQTEQRLAAKAQKAGLK